MYGTHNGQGAPVNITTLEFNELRKIKIQNCTNKVIIFTVIIITQSPRISSLLRNSSIKLIGGEESAGNVSSCYI